MPAWHVRARTPLARCRLAQLTVLVDGFEQPGVVIGGLIRREQVGEHHGTGQVGDVLAADHPAVVRLAHDHIVIFAVSSRWHVSAHVYTRFPPSTPVLWHWGPNQHYP